MKKKMIAMIIGALLLACVSGMAVHAEEAAAEASVEDAVETALGDAGVAAADAAVYKKVWEFSDGMQKYDIHFLIPGQMKYEYEFDARTGEILEHSAEAWEPEDDMEYAGLTAGYTPDPEADTAAIQKAVETAINDAGEFGNGAVVYRYGPDLENGKSVISVNFFLAGQTKYEYDIDVQTGEIVTREQEAWEPDDDMEFAGLLDPEAAAAKASSASGELTEKDALAIALQDAGLAESDVTVTENHREMDDGIDKYSISFRTADGAEYDYDIDALNGSILEKSKEYDD